MDQQPNQQSQINEQPREQLQSQPQQPQTATADKSEKESKKEEFLTKYNIELPKDHVQETKALMLIAVSIIFAVIAFISIFFGLRIKNQPELFIKNSNKQDTQIVEENNQEQDQTQEQEEEPYDPTQLDPEKELNKLDDLKLEDFENTYSDETLDL